MKQLLDLARECGAQFERRVVKHGFYGRAYDCISMTESQLAAFAVRIRHDERERLAAKWEISHGFDKYGVAAAIRSSGEQGESNG